MKIQGQAFVLVILKKKLKKKLMKYHFIEQT